MKVIPFFIVFLEVRLLLFLRISYSRRDLLAVWSCVHACRSGRFAISIPPSLRFLCFLPAFSLLSSRFLLASSLLPSCFLLAFSLLPSRFLLASFSLPSLFRPCFLLASALLPPCFLPASFLLPPRFLLASSLLPSCFLPGLTTFQGENAVSPHLKSTWIFCDTQFIVYRTVYKLSIMCLNLHPYKRKIFRLNLIRNQIGRFFLLKSVFKHPIQHWHLC